MKRRNQSPRISADDPATTPRAALYMRVSTGRQAEHDLSIPDQRSQLRSWCRAKGHDVVAEFVEAGASAGDDRRPVFQQMIERACDGEQAFDLIMVHSYSRFFREAFEQEFYLRKLAKHGVRVISITQPVGDESEPVHAMMRKVIALFDEYQSKENAKHVIRSMKENARQGFWNGATAPLGYKVVEAEKRGTKIKKKLDVDPVEAETVRLMFKLYLHGDGSSGALGVKEVVKWLNANGYRSRRGNTFGVGNVHKILTKHHLHRAMEVQSDLVKDRANESLTMKSSRFRFPPSSTRRCLSRSSASCGPAARESCPRASRQARSC